MKLQYHAKAFFSLWLVHHVSGDRQLRQRREQEETTLLDIEYDFRIVGGSNAPSGKYPYMARGGGCGASLIAPDMLLTAAHCESAFGGDIRIGSTSRNSGGEIARKEFQIQHPNYKGSNNDFMIVKLDREVKAAPVKLNSNPNNPTVNAPLTVIGFGRTSEGGSSSDRLKEVTVPYVSHDKCRGVYGSTIQEATMLCAG